MCDEPAITAQSLEEGTITFLGIFACAPLEAAFRRQHHPSDLWLSRVCVITGAARVAFFLFADYGAFGWHSLFPLLFACRCLFVLYSVWVLKLMRQETAPPRRVQVLFTWCVLLGTLTTFFFWTRPPANIDLALLNVGVVLGAYCVLPLPLSLQLLVAVVFSLASFAVALSGQMADVALEAFGVAYLMANAVGAIISWQLHRRRRQVFLGAMRETELRLQLEQALAEVKTLRGVLSICAWCKRIRNEAEIWQRVEDYVKAHSNAEFTHGICPQCLKDQIRDHAISPSMERTAKKEVGVATE